MTPVARDGAHRSMAPEGGGPTAEMHGDSGAGPDLVASRSSGGINSARNQSPAHRQGRRDYRRDHKDTYSWKSSPGGLGLTQIKKFALGLAPTPDNTDR
jgi:hypothetical protein